MHQLILKRQTLEIPIFTLTVIFLTAVWPEILVLLNGDRNRADQGSHNNIIGTFDSTLVEVQQFAYMVIEPDRIAKAFKKAFDIHVGFDSCLEWHWLAFLRNDESSNADQVVRHTVGELAKHEGVNDKALRGIHANSIKSNNIQSLFILANRLSSNVDVTAFICSKCSPAKTAGKPSSVTGISSPQKRLVWQMSSSCNAKPQDSSISNAR